MPLRISSEAKPKVGISACLLGQRVRFDGGDKRDDWLVDELGKWITWYPVCPEMEMGLGSPRESMRLALVAGASGTRLLTNRSNRDLTVPAQATARGMVARLPELDGFVLKKSSPSCGLERVKVYNRKGIPDPKGEGFFAAELKRRFPDLPMIEEGRLTDPEQREHFVTRIFAARRWRDVPARVSAVQKFHETYKLLIMAHSPAHYRALGRIAANPERRIPTEVRDAYGRLFPKALALPPTPAKRINVLQHILGYFKRTLSSKERHAILESLEEYRDGELPFLSVLLLLRHQLTRLSVPYLEGQLFFEPYPKRLAKRRFG